MTRLSSTRFSLAAALAAIAGFVVPSAAQANILSLLPGSCGVQPASQPFVPWGDSHSYTLVPGGNFETAGVGWALSDGAAVSGGNESFYVGGAGDSHSLSLPIGSSALSPAVCTDIYHPTVRFFAQNSGSPSSRLVVQVLYPTLLGIGTTTIGSVSGSSGWAPSDAMSLGSSNLLATLSLSQTAVAFRFTAVGAGGDWSIDDVYQDPYGRK